MAQLQRQISPGSSAIGFHGSFAVWSILVDNPTGAWVTITSPNKVETWSVPPYTVGWARTFTKSQPSLDISTTVTPTTQVSSTKAGDIITLTITDQATSNSEGITFIDQNVQPTWQTFEYQQAGTLVNFGPNTAGVWPQIPLPVGSRYRISNYAISAQAAIGVRLDSAVRMKLLDSSGLRLGKLLFISPNVYSDEYTFVPSIDLVTDHSLLFHVICDNVADLWEMQAQIAIV